MPTPSKLTMVYHGTSAENATEIMQRGFNIGTYFALHLEDALGFGGNHIFEVVFPWKEIKRVYWQFTLSECIPADRIVRYDVYQDKEVKFRNERLGDKVFLSNITAQERKSLIAQIEEAGVSNLRELDEKRVPSGKRRKRKSG